MLDEFWSAIPVAIVSWHQGKLFLQHSLAISHDSLHVIVGVLFWIAAAMLVRRPLTSWPPWLWLLVATLLNEAIDVWVDRWPDTGWQLGEGVKDLVLTMIVPTILFAAFRRRPDLFRAGLGQGRR